MRPFPEDVTIPRRRCCPLLGTRFDGKTAVSSATSRPALPAPMEGDALRLLEESILPGYIAARRWYAAKDAGAPRVQVLDAIPVALPDGGAQLCLLRVEPPGRTPQLYLLPLILDRHGDGDDAFRIAAAESVPWAGSLCDGFGDDGFVRALVAGMRDGRDSHGLSFGHSSAFADVAEALTGEPPIRRSSAEQSNTSIRIGDAAILKGFRKLEAGLHPELEVGRFLTEVAHFEGTPPLLGWLEHRAGAGEPTALAVLQAQITGCVDGWAHITGHLSERVDRFRDEDAAGDRAALDLLRCLGARTAELHRAFAIPSDQEAFRPEPVDRGVLDSWKESVRGLARRTLDSLDAAVGGLPAGVAAQARSLLACEPAILAQIDALTPAAADIQRTRLHGDFHLGQVLVADGAVYIIDFEGEPMRPLAERRGKHCPLRDVAGMLRSVAYAAASVRQAHPGLDPERSSWLDWWEGEAAGAFLDGYLDAIADCPSIPADPGARAALLKLFLLEKALYEVGYELANRPGWLAIPMTGVLGILGADAGDDVADRMPGRIGTAGPGAIATGEARAHAMPFGAQVLPDGAVRFRLWAPMHDRIDVRLEDAGATLAMENRGGGWHELTTAQAQAGTRYRFVLPDGLAVPDPASRFQPEDVAGPSEVIDATLHRWTDSGWTGRPWHETVLYELHVGTFTPEGTFRSAIDRLDHLVGLGVTAIELLPIADFPGRWNWGYDGVLPYAPDGAYGRPDDLRALVEAAHARRLMVFLDVVYNHFGPEGNYLNAYAPSVFTDRHHTPWGSAINMDGGDSGPVRDFFIHNALYWIEEFHLDGLRFDAVHAILDDSDRHFLEELGERVRDAAGGRHVHLVLENDANQARFLTRDRHGLPLFHTAQWNDDLHHALHAGASGESGGYYADYAGDTARLARSLAEGFAYQGDPSPFRDGELRGEPSAHLPPTAFVSFLQNHDQIGNRAFGERITAFSDPAAVRAAACLYLLGPQIPMLFMGEEWASARPFPFFCDFEGELADAVRHGRRQEFAAFPEFRDPEARRRIPDPIDGTTMASAKLDWEALAEPAHADWLDWYRRALAVRGREIAPRLEGAPGGASRHRVVGTAGVVACWTLGDGSILHLRANLSAEPVTGLGEVPGRILWTEGDGLSAGTLAPWNVVWSLEVAGPLDRLARRMGIEADYTNAAGQAVRTPTAVTCALLSAMGVDAADGAAAERSLAAMERRDRERPLPPVAVLRVDQPPFGVALTLPAGTGPVVWTLTEEDGGERRGEVDFAALPLLRSTSLGGASLEIRRLALGEAPPEGYHRFGIEAGGTTAACPLIAVPERCHLPAALAMGERIWGLAAQLYAVRSATDWGIGDFGDLASLAEVAAGHGASVIGLNPLHTLFLDHPDQASPYSPLSRLFLNPLYIDVTAVPELPGCAAVLERLADDAFRRELDTARAATHVDYAAVARLKLPLLERLFGTFREMATEERRSAFEMFRHRMGPSLERLCQFQALREAHGPDWRNWPEGLRSPDGADATAFRTERAERVEFFAWLQWVADEQLGAAAERAAQRGMAVGFYRDLAVGADSSGAETWSAPAVVVSGAQVGAPPDLFNPAGQDWGLPPLNPQALREAAYAPFIELVRANMRHAGAIRIDHAMALQHVYWIPRGRPASEGAYVGYPMEDLIGILALESRRNRCLVVGEDLGTVPPGFRERMAEAAILSYRVVFFEWTADGGFIGPEDYPAPALATVGSHDLATLRGWWEGHDLHLKQTHGLYPAEGEFDRQRARRDAEKGKLVDALRDAGLPLPAGFGADSPYGPALAYAMHAFLARTEAAVAMVQLDELTAELAQVNLPGTVDQYPNWRRKLSQPLEAMADDERASAIACIMAAARPAPRRTS